MARRRKKGYKNPSQIQAQRGTGWFHHYYDYLTSLAFQLFEWEGLPPTVDPLYLERQLHENGFVAFYKDKRIGYIATSGSFSGTYDHYNLPDRFHAYSVAYRNTFPLYNYSDMKSDKMGVAVYNNLYKRPTLASLEMFAEDLAELKEVIYVNQNAQKTPYLIAANDMTRFTMMQVYNQVEANAPAILVDEDLDLEQNLKVFQTPAPYVVDKLNTQKNAVWNEVMTFLGIKNANLEKKERMISDEAKSNDEQIEASGNIFLVARQEAAKKINDLYGLNIKVKMRTEIVEQLLDNVSRETSKEGETK